MDTFDSIISQLSVYHDRELLVKLSDLGVIAGGSIAFCLSGIGQVNDIDVFLLGSDKCDYMPQIIEIFKNLDITCSTAEKRGVLNVKLSNRNVEIQFIFSLCSSMKETCDNFDFDYVGCGIHKGEFYCSEECKNENENLVIEKYPGIIHRHQPRLFKAVKKGYSSYFFGYEVDHYVCPKIKVELINFKPENFDTYIESSNTTLSDFRFEKFLFDICNTIKGAKYQSGQFKIKYKNGEKSKSIQLKSVCMKFTIESLRDKQKIGDFVRYECLGMELSSQVKVFRKLYILLKHDSDFGDQIGSIVGTNHILTKDDLGVQRNWQVRCYKTGHGNIHGVIVGKLHEGWIPFPN